MDSVAKAWVLIILCFSFVLCSLIWSVTLSDYIRNSKNDPHLACIEAKGLYERVNDGNTGNTYYRCVYVK